MPLISLPFHHKTLPESSFLGTEDISNVPSDTVDATPERDDRPGDTLPPKVPHSESSRTLHRTISCASIETVRPPSKKGICRRIVDMADNMTLGSVKKSKYPSMQDLPEMTTSDPVSDSKNSSERKLTRRRQKSTTRSQYSSHKSGKEDTLGTVDRLCDNVPSKQDAPSTFIECTVPSLIDELLPEGDGLCLDYFSPYETNLEVHVAKEHKGTFHFTSQVDIKDVVLSIQPSELDVTIWDGLETAHHMFKCRLFVQCTTHPYDSVPLPDIRRIEMNCHTCPAGSRYAQPPALQCTYEDASSNRTSRSNAVTDASLGAGIHVDKFWRTIMKDDGRWGWYRDASVPLSSRLFDKIEYREFKVVGRVRVGESFVEDELRFGISMLRREVNMR